MKTKQGLWLGVWLSCGLIGLGLGGCATAPRHGIEVGPPAQPWETGQLPTLTLAGARETEVKALAMGAARARGWTLTETAEQHSVAQRPFPGATDASTLEVTSYFVQRPGAVAVYLAAARLSQGADGTPLREDVTEQLRPTLMQSLESLRQSWNLYHPRVARAAPPTRAPAGAYAEEDDLPTADLVADQPSDPAPVAAGARAPTAAETAPIPAPAPAPALAPAPVPSAAPTLAAPRPGSTGGAPVTDATLGGPTPIRREPPPAASMPALAGPVGASPSAAAAPPLPAPVPQDHMLTLPSASARQVTWTYYAEQYARLNGCDIADQGALLIEARGDGEIHRVPCIGQNSVLVLCERGECRGLL